MPRCSRGRLLSRRCSGAAVRRSRTWWSWASTAVELLPVLEYDELEFQRSPNTRDHMVNIWGYSHISFIAPMARFAADGAGPTAAARELKELVRALHDAGIEVILDVVFNHTVEGPRPEP